MAARSSTSSVRSSIYSARPSTSSARPSSSSARLSTSSARLSTSSARRSVSRAAIKPEDYAHSPVHYALAIGDHAALSRILSSLPKLADPDQINTEADSIKQERLADRISAVLDRRDVPFRETPLHLAVRLNDSLAARTIAAAGADFSLQNAAGWNALQEALCRRSSDLALIFRLYHRSAMAKWRRRLPRLVAVLRRMRDFYMEISFHFESSIVPFVGKIAPSDTYKIWKRDGNLRADTSLSGFDGMKIQRADQSFLFLGEGDREHCVPAGSLLVLNRDERKVVDAFENAGSAMKEPDIAGFCSQSSVYRPGMDVTKAELVGRTNWRRQVKAESVGQWKARVYEVQHVTFSFRSRKIAGEADFAAGSEQVLPLDLELDEDDEGFLVADNLNFGIADKRRHSSFIREDRDLVALGRRSVDIPSAIPERRTMSPAAPPPPLPPAKEKEYVRSLRPSLWLTEQFPLKTEELLPLLDILAHKVKAVGRMRELLTTKLPPGTFPVKLAIPVVPTVRVVITFTKFVDLAPAEEFHTPLSSPREFEDETEERHRPSSATAWLRRSNSHSTSSAASKQQDAPDPFAIPSGYTWSRAENKNTKVKKSTSTRKSMQLE